MSHQSKNSKIREKHRDQVFSSLHKKSMFLYCDHISVWGHSSIIHTYPDSTNPLIISNPVLLLATHSSLMCLWPKVDFAVSVFTSVWCRGCMPGRLNQKDTGLGDEHFGYMLVHACSFSLGKYQLTQPLRSCVFCCCCWFVCFFKSSKYKQPILFWYKLNQLG